jgi:hypothetical protein
MVISRAATVADYLAELPPERRAVIEAVRAVVLANLDAGYEEGIQYGMISYHVPHRLFPAGYHCDPTKALPFAGLAAQKRHYALYLAGVYCGCDGGPESKEARWFRDAWTSAGKKLDMGKACVRFARLEDVPLAVVGEAIARIPAKLYLRQYQAVLDGIAAAKGAGKATPARARAKAKR